MKLSTQVYKGARDFYPQDQRIRKFMFNVLRDTVESFGYEEYDAPILEPLELYLAKSGEEIVNQQLYSFEDKGGRKVALRPEMTPSVSRMVAARRQQLAYPLRWYSIPNLWRYERPQAGRLREHWQLNVDIFGVGTIEADHEIIQIADAILKNFGAPPGSYVIRISSRRLVDFFFRKILELNAEQAYEASKLIDRWHKISKAEFEPQARQILTTETKWQQLKELLDCKDVNQLPASVKAHASVVELQKLLSMLAASKVEAAFFDFSIIRGMDYYDDIIFEVFDTNPENIRSMFGGGRYDGLVGLFGVETLPTVGFGMGDVTLQRFLEVHKLLPALPTPVDARLILIGDVYEKALPFIEQLRQKGLNVAVDMVQRKLDQSIKHAVKSGVGGVFFLGEAELKNKKVKVKHLKTGQERELTLNEAARAIEEWRTP